MIKFYSDNSRKLLESIHKLNQLKSDLSQFSDQDVIMEYVIEKKARQDFHLASHLGERSCYTLVCRLCGGDKFIIGQKEYYSALKCTQCDYELGIHEG